MVVPADPPSVAAPRFPASDWWLLASNLLTLGLALWQGWSLVSLLLPFWVQSVAIGALQARRMWLLQQAPCDGQQTKGSAPAESVGELRQTLRTFVLHYGAFHAFYLLVLLVFMAAERGAANPVDAWLLPCVVALLVSEWLAHRDDVRRDAQQRPPLGPLMILPYLRILPMHMMVFIGSVAGSSSISVAAFLLLKTACDWATQWGKRKHERVDPAPRKRGR